MIDVGEVATLLKLGQLADQREHPIAWTWCQCCGVKIPAPPRIRYAISLCESCWPYWKDEPFEHTVTCWHTGKLTQQETP